MKQIFFATHNAGKLEEFKEILGKEFEVSHIAGEIDERRSDDPVDIAKDKAKRLCEKHKKTIVAEDSGLFIDALGGFPGTCSAYIHKRIGLDGILKLMDGLNNRRCEYKSAVAIASPGEEAVGFLGYEKGEISKEIRGNSGFGHDPIFIPSGESSTYGEMESAKEKKKFRRNALVQLVKYLKMKDSKNIK